MTPSRIDIHPAPGGWLVECPAAALPLMFRSGARAEAKAHQLARTLAALGRPVEVIVRDRREQVVGVTLYPAHEVEDSPPRVVD